jgi:hypothetical protein
MCNLYSLTKGQAAIIALVRDARSYRQPERDGFVVPALRLSGTAAVRMTRLHLLRVRLSAFAGSAVHRMTAENGSSRSETSNRCKHSARRARSTSRPSVIGGLNFT